LIQLVFIGLFIAGSAIASATFELLSGADLDAVQSNVLILGRLFVVAMLIKAVVQYLPGRWIGQRAHGREIAGCVIFELSVLFINNALRWPLNRFAPKFVAGPAGFASIGWPTCLFMILRFAGAIRARINSRERPDY
jgi:hypothetical protein